MKISSGKLRYKQYKGHPWQILLNARIAKLYNYERNSLSTILPFERTFILHTRYYPIVIHAYAPSSHINIYVKLSAIGGIFRAIPKVSLTIPRYLLSLENKIMYIAYCSEVTACAEIDCENPNLGIRLLDLSHFQHAELDVDKTWYCLRILLSDLPKIPKVEGIEIHELPVYKSNRKEKVIKNELRRIKINYHDDYDDYVLPIVLLENEFLIRFVVRSVSEFIEFIKRFV